MGMRRSKSNRATPASSESTASKISAQEEADLSSALIAKLLAEDSMGGNYASYYEDYGNSAAYGDAGDDYASGSEADDDWDPNLKRRRKAKGSKGRKSLGTAASALEEDSSSASDSERERPKRQKKLKEKPAPQPVEPGQYRSGAYTDEEEKKFYEGLELYGRSWTEISQHVVTRDPKSIRSHAQKFFIKLFRDKVPLPEKVRESGEGYTLSGKPLDPNSAAARPYLQHVMQLDPLPPKPQRALPPASPSKPDSHSPQEQPTGINEAAKIKSDTADSKPADSETNGDASVQPAPSDDAHKPATESQQTESELPSAEPAEAAEPLKAPERTEYAKSRPQRSQARSTALRFNDPHQMVRCTPFAGQPLSKVAGSQPFRLTVHTNAQLQMDFHAHLMLSEVIGLLGGCWNAQERVLTVTRAFPCRALETDDAHTNVEMDPDSELDVRHQITEAGLRVVGWYHSHPTFRPDPSIIDIENQTAYQSLFRDNESSEEPFVGAIVGPYDPKLPGPVSVFNWFYVGRSAIDRGHPKRLVVETVHDSSLPESEQSILFRLLENASSLKHHAPLEEAWRPSSTEMRSLKMAVSLAHRMPWLASSSSTPDVEVPSEPCDEDAAERAGQSPKPESAAGETASADSASDCTVTEAVPAKDTSEPALAKQQISQTHILAGQKATQDAFLSALAQRFSAGVFKADASGEMANSQALARVFAAHFMQWAL
ncbi:hypothetical protein LPJ79_003404 [Coemansia sp. RSA 1821]|nr:hypothetical protein LPJ79_003404 [Coemansia sp. RSA 1821]